jgi:hypothetical protein
VLVDFLHMLLNTSDMLEVYKVHWHILTEELIVNVFIVLKLQLVTFDLEVTILLKVIKMSWQKDYTISVRFQWLFKLQMILWIIILEFMNNKAVEQQLKM